MNTCIIRKMYCKHRFQILTDPTALPHRPHSALCKRQAAALFLSMRSAII